jgi:hypothetical protein
VNTEIDSLEVRVQSDSQSAAAGLDKLITALGQLKTATTGVSGLSTLANGLTKLNTALSQLNVNKKGLGALKTSLSGLSGIKTNLTTTANQITKVNAAMSALQVDQSKLSSLASALNSLGQIQKPAGLTSAVNALKQLPQITKSLSSSELRKFGVQMQLVAKYMAPLATEMEKVSKGFSAFPVRIQKIIQGNSGLAASNKTAANSFNLFNSPISKAIAKFTAYGFVTRRIVSFLADCVTSINEYVENVNLFQVSMGEYYDEAFAYAQLVNEKLGIDPSEWMRNQGVFMSMANGFGIASDQAYALSEGLTELSYDLSSLYNEDMQSSALRLQSALAGEIEPIRRLGISISEATLKEYALSLGIDKSVESMTEQEKALLRAMKLMEGAANIGAIGDFARTLESPANALRVLNQQITQFKRAIGSVMLPVLIQILPYLQAFVEIITDAISALAVLAGFTMPEWDASDWSSGITSGASDATDAIGEATSAAKELKNATLGIDELNIISPNTGSGSGGGAGSGWTSDLEIPDIWDKNALANMQTQVDEIKEKMRPVLILALAIGTALAAWKIATGLARGIVNIRDGLGLLKTAFEAVFGTAALQKALNALTGFAAACAIQFNIAGGGLKGVLSVLKLIGQTALASPLVAIVAMAAQFANLYANSEKFREGLSRMGEIMGGVFTVVGDVLGGIFTVLGDIGKALLNLFPESVRTAILNGIETIRGALSNLDIGFGDLGITILGIAALFVPGGQLVGVALLAFEAITLGIRALGGVAGETWEGIKTSAVNAWNNIKTSASELWTSIKEGLAGAWTSTVEFFTESLPTWWEETIAPWFTLEKWQELGKQAIDGLFQGLSNIWENAKSWGSDLLNDVKEVLGIHSPSKEFAAIGEYSVAGLEQGFGKLTSISSMFSGQLQIMQGQATAFSNSTKVTIDATLLVLQQALSAAQSSTQASTDAMALNYKTMAAQSNAAIQSIISYLNAIPREITTVHTIVTKYESGSGGGTATTSTVSAYASGGFPEYGQLFLANEEGPEMVGTIGNQTAVANTQQIIEGIASGVSEANMTQNALLREQNELLRAILDKEGVTYLDGKRLYKSVEKAARNTGVVIMSGGVV